jgi:hypothetical protein
MTDSHRVTDSYRRTLRKNNSMSVEGTWDLSISTPIGTIKAVVELLRQNGVLTGAAHGAEEVVPLSDVAVDGDQVTKPMRLNLAFAVTVTRDTLTGTAKAGRLPASKVTGQRRRPTVSDPAETTD